MLPPLPSRDDVEMARTSPAERLRVDRMYAAACGLDEGATIAFCERVALFDVRTQIADEEASLAYLEAVRAAKDRVVSPRPASATRRLSRRRPARSEAA